jgi:hypothetical protein
MLPIVAGMSSMSCSSRAERAASRAIDKEKTACPHVGDERPNTRGTTPLHRRRGDGLNPPAVIDMIRQVVVR